jgi:hypothetical protein
MQIDDTWVYTWQRTDRLLHHMTAKLPMISKVWDFKFWRDFKDFLEVSEASTSLMRFQGFSVWVVERWLIIILYLIKDEPSKKCCGKILPGDWELWGHDVPKKHWAGFRSCTLQGWILPSPLPNVLYNSQIFKTLMRIWEISMIITFSAGLNPRWFLPSQRERGFHKIIIQEEQTTVFSPMLLLPSWNTSKIHEGWFSASQIVFSKNYRSSQFPNEML